MDFTVTSKGPDLAALMLATARGMERANRTAGRDIARRGSAAMRKGAPRMFGRKLGVKSKTSATSSSCRVAFTGKPAGGWAIADSGARPHTIKPRRARVLAFDGRYATVVEHPGTTGHKAWVKAGDRLRAVVDDTVDDVYGDAIHGR